MNFDLPDITLSQLVMRMGAALLTLIVYGPVTVWAVRRAGDPGPAQDGRLTLSPLAHLDIIGLIAAIFFRVTWMRPIDVDARRFRSPAAGMAFALAMSTLALLLLAVAALFARPLMLRAFSSSVAFSSAALLTATSEVAVTTALLNLLPIPPLVGSMWLTLLGPKVASLARRTEARVVGTALVAVLLLSGLARPAFGWAWTTLRGAVGF